MVYLDNSATTRVYDEVARQMVEIMTKDYGNPSSKHTKGLEAETHIKWAKSELARLLKAEEKEIVFTSGGTESDNLALIGCAEANKRAGNHIIVSSIEHPAVTEVADYLEMQGFRITRLPVDADGIIDMQAFNEALCDETILVSVMYVNNEIGSVQPIEAISNLIREKSPKAIFHVDAVQAFGKYKIYPKRMGIDLMSVSGHKIHGPKGVGFLYVNNKVKIKPVVFGGGQQSGLRSGTENVPGIVGIALAAKMIYDGLDEKRERMFDLKRRLIDGVSDIPDIYVNGKAGEESAPHIVNISFIGVRSEVLLNTFVSNDICVSSGSACSTHKQTVSSTLKAMGADSKRMDSAIRFSFSEWTTKEEIDKCIEVIHKELPMLRRFIRK